MSQDEEDIEIMDDDLLKDPDFQPMDDMEKEPISDDMNPLISLAIRLGISSYASTLLINQAFQVANREDLMISRQGFDKVKKRILEEAKTTRDKENQQLYCIQFDGKVCEELSVGNKLIKKDHITVVNGTNGQYIDHFIPKTGSGLNIGLGVSNVIASTDSLGTIRAVNCGK